MQYGDAILQWHESTVSECGTVFFLFDDAGAVRAALGIRYVTRDPSHPSAKPVALALPPALFLPQTALKTIRGLAG